jgi:uncharacterized membrane protein
MSMVMSDKTESLENPAVWTYRGYKLRPGEFNTAMVHFYRAEVQRASAWRNRLDVTTNWAMVATSAAITFAFGNRDAHHSVIIVNTLLITLFLFIEARRYRYYELFSYRVRLMETDFYAAMLIPPFKPDSEWANKVATSLLNPNFPISYWEAFGRRFRRNYMWIYLILALAWIAKIILYPEVITSWQDILNRTRMGVIPGWMVILSGVVFNGVFFMIGLLTRNLRDATGEVLARYGQSAPIATTAKTNDPIASNRAAPEDTPRYLAVVTSEQIETLSPILQTNLQRPITRLDPNNTMGSQNSLTLMVELTEIAQLKALVRTHDPAGGVVVIPAQDIQHDDR